MNDELINTIQDLFIIRNDVYATQQKNGVYFKEIYEITANVIKGHLEGKKTIGTYTLNKDNHCKWICFDFDGENLEKEKEKAIKLSKHLFEKGYENIIEFSGKKGYHVWVFFKKTDGYSAYKFGRTICNGHDVHEIFPKQYELTEEKPYGNLVKLPLGIHQVVNKRSMLLHPTTYELMDFERSMNFLYTFSKRPIKDIPKYIREEIIKTIESKSSIPIVKKEMDESTKKLIEKGKKAGNRHPTCFGIIKDLYNKGWKEEEIIKEALKFNSNCDPPKQDSMIIGHVQRLFKNKDIYLKKPDFDLEGMRKEFEKILENDKIRQEENKLSKEKRREQGLPEEKIPFDQKGFYYKCSKILLRHINFKTTRDNEEIYYYNDVKGIYENSGEQLICLLLDKYLEKHATILTKREIIAHIKHRTFIDRTDFNNDPTKIVLKNGVLDLETLEVYEFNKDYLYTINIPIEYDPEAKCDTWINMLKEKTVCEEDIITLQDYFGFCLLNDMRFEKALLLYGTKRSSKSTVLFVLSNLLGEENITNMTLHFLNENKFALAYLYGVKANICADLPTESLKSISKFMLITGRDRITCDKKGKDPSSFYSIAKPVFSCNQIPRIPVKEDAFYRRWIILNFPYSTDIDKVDEHFKTDLLNELKGILNWAIEGAKRILRTHEIYYNKTEDDVKDIWNKNSDTITSFIYNDIITDDLEKELIRNVYNVYLEYCKSNKLRPENKWIFGRVFKLETGCGTCRIDKLPAYAGIKLKSKNVEENNEKQGELDEWSC